MRSHYQIQKFKKVMCVLCSSRKWSGIAQNARHRSAKHNLNIDLIQKEIKNCKANRGQEMHAVIEDCTNKDAQSAVKQDDNGQHH